MDAQAAGELIAPVHAPQARPSTFSLSDDALRREANRLFRAGWPALEVVQVLALPMPELAS